MCESETPNLAFTIREAIKPTIARDIIKIDMGLLIFFSLFDNWNRANIKNANIAAGGYIVTRSINDKVNFHIFALVGFSLYCKKRMRIRSKNVTPRLRGSKYKFPSRSGRLLSRRKNIAENSEIEYFFDNLKTSRNIKNTFRANIISLKKL